MFTFHPPQKSIIIGYISDVNLRCWARKRAVIFNVLASLKTMIDGGAGMPISIRAHLHFRLKFDKY
jgi:hypothetical protein